MWLATLVRLGMAMGHSGPLMGCAARGNPYVSQA